MILNLLNLTVLTDSDSALTSTFFLVTYLLVIVGNFLTSNFYSFICLFIYLFIYLDTSSIHCFESCGN